MEFKYWIIGQIVIDGLIFLLLLLIFGVKYGRGNLAKIQKNMERANGILSEIEEITSRLENLLEEKKGLMENLLSGMDDKIKRAETICEQLGHVKYPVNGLVEEGYGLRDKKKQIPVKTVRKLMKKGMTKEEISKYLNLPSGEIDLIMKLDPITRKDETSSQTKK